MQAPTARPRHTAGALQARHGPRRQARQPAAAAGPWPHAPRGQRCRRLGSGGQEGGFSCCGCGRSSAAVPLKRALPAERALLLHSLSSQCT